MLTPETIKRELLNLLHKVENISDPRIYNNPLPNDSKPTRQFGALAYVFDGYPGFVWRMGSWYKITPRLCFSKLPPDEAHKLLFKPIVKGVQFKDNLPDTTMQLDAAYYPVKIDGIRVFCENIGLWLKLKKNIPSKYGGMEYQNVNTPHLAETVLYSPELQACIQCSRTRLDLRDYPDVVFEDPEYVDMLNKM